MNKHFLAGILVLSAAIAAVPQNNPSDDFKFEIVSVRALSHAESIKIAGPDFIGGDVLVRLRLSAVGRNLFYSGFRQLKLPVGFRIKLEGDQKVWLAPDAKVQGQRESPGFERLHVPAEWFKLEKGKSLEWDLIDSTGDAGELHGQSTFIKFLPNDKPMEIFSDSYKVPQPVASKK